MNDERVCLNICKARLLVLEGQVVGRSTCLAIAIHLGRDLDVDHVRRYILWELRVKHGKYFSERE